MALGCARKNAGSFQTLAMSSSRSSGGVRLPGLDVHLSRNVAEQTVLLVVHQLSFLALLHLLDDQAQLLAYLVMRAPVQIGDARVHIECGRHRAQRVFTRVLFIIDVNLGQQKFLTGAALNRASSGGSRLHLVDTVPAGFDGHPRQKTDQPARRDLLHHGHRLGDDGELACRLYAQCVTNRGCPFGHGIGSLRAA